MRLIMTWISLYIYININIYWLWICIILIHIILYHISGISLNLGAVPWSPLAVRAPRCPHLATTIGHRSYRSWGFRPQWRIVTKGSDVFFSAGRILTTQRLGSWWSLRIIDNTVIDAHCTRVSILLYVIPFAIILENLEAFKENAIICHSPKHVQVGVILQSFQIFPKSMPASRPTESDLFEPPCFENSLPEQVTDLVTPTEFSKQFFSIMDPSCIVFDAKIAIAAATDDLS